MLRSCSVRGMADNLCTPTDRTSGIGKAGGMRAGARREHAPRSRHLQADKKNVAARLCSGASSVLPSFACLPLLSVLFRRAVLARGAVVPLVGRQGSAASSRVESGRPASSCASPAPRKARPQRRTIYLPHCMAAVFVARTDLSTTFHLFQVELPKPEACFA